MACKAYVTASANKLKRRGIKKELLTVSVLDLYKQLLLIAKDDDGMSYAKDPVKPYASVFVGHVVSV